MPRMLFMRNLEQGIDNCTNSCIIKLKLEMEFHFQKGVTMSEVSNAVIRALTILDYLSLENGPRRLIDIAQSLALPESTTQRLLASLAAKGYIQQNPLDQTYRLGWKVATLAKTFNKETWLIENIRPFMHQLSRQVSRTVNLAVLQNGRVVPLECVLPERTIAPLYTWPGSWFPVHATALGKALLANLSPDEAEMLLSQLTLEAYTEATITDLAELKRELQQVRLQGYAVNHGEYVPEERCVAAPIKDSQGIAVAAISITARTSELPPELEPQMIAAVMATANQVSRALFEISPES